MPFSAIRSCTGNVQPCSESPISEGLLCSPSAGAHMGPPSQLSVLRVDKESHGRLVLKLDKIFFEEL